MARPRAALAAVLFLSASVAHAQEPADATAELRDPLEIRDEHVLAQGRLTLPASGADPVGKGVTRLHLSFLWGNSFSWAQEAPGEAPDDRRFLIDGETATLDLTVTRGLSASTDLALRLPLRWRGGGTLDGFIDAWHRAVGFLGIPDGNRPEFRKDAFRVEGITTQGDPFAWEDSTGTGFGNLELAPRWRFHQGDRTSLAVVGRLSLPTASEPYEAVWGTGAQIVSRVELADVLDLHAGAGGTWESETRVRGIAYEETRWHGYLSLVYRPWRRLSLAVETDVATRLVADIDSYPGLHWLINGGLKFAARPGFVLELGMTENLASQGSTTDFAAYVAVSLRP